MFKLRNADTDPMLAWRVIGVIPHDDINERLGQVIRNAIDRKHLSYRDLAKEVRQLGGEVSASTIENIAQNPMKSELGKVYWVLRALGISIGESLEFTVEHLEDRAHALLALAMRGDAATVKIVLDFLKYVGSHGIPSQEKTPRRA